VRHNTALLFGIIRIIEKSHAVREGRLQARITDTHILRIGVVHNRQQILHTRLAATPAVCYTQLAHFGETEAQVQVRSEVEHIAGGINHIVATFIGQHRMLRLKRHTCAQLILLADKAQGHGCIVVVVAIFRILTQTVHRMLFISRGKLG